MERSNELNATFPNELILKHETYKKVSFYIDILSTDKLSNEIFFFSLPSLIIPTGWGRLPSACNGAVGLS